MKKMEQIYQGVVIRKFFRSFFCFEGLGFFFLIFVFIFLFGHVIQLAGEILVPSAEIEPSPTAVEVRSPQK